MFVVLKEDQESIFVGVLENSIRDSTEIDFTAALVVLKEARDNIFAKDPEMEEHLLKVVDSHQREWDEHLPLLDGV